MKKIKSIVLSLAVMWLLMPCMLHGQGLYDGGSGSSGSDGFFKDTGSQYRDFDASGDGNEAYNTTDTPLGNGIALLTALGIGYGVMKRRKNAVADN